MEELKNRVSDILNSGGLALGLVVRLARSGEIARVAKSCGYDFLFLDRQHAIYSLETISHITQTALGCGVTPMVRVRSCDDPDVSALLDSGVCDIVFPDVNTADDARRAVDACKYAPVGKRSVSGPYALVDFRSVPIGALKPALNANTLVVCMIESREGLHNIDEICSVEGVDVVHVGCNDLLADMEKSGQFGHPEIMEAVAHVAATARRRRVFAGAGGDQNPDRQARFIQDGIQFISTQSDLGLLMQAGSELVSGLRTIEAAAKQSEHSERQCSDAGHLRGRK